MVLITSSCSLASLSNSAILLVICRSWRNVRRTTFVFVVRAKESPTGQLSSTSNKHRPWVRFPVEHQIGVDSTASSFAHRSTLDSPTCARARSSPFDPLVRRTCCTSWRRRLNFRTTSSPFLGSVMLPDLHKSAVDPSTSCATTVVGRWSVRHASTRESTPEWKGRVGTREPALCTAGEQER
eukprot:scaffold776_cov347-Pavlova_lutheri.AAC.14